MSRLKTQSLFLLSVLLLSITSLPLSFSNTQINSDLFGYPIPQFVVGTAFADDDDEDENDDDNDDNGKKGKNGGKQKIEVEIEDGEAEVEIRIDGTKASLELETDNLDEIIIQIQTITGLSENEIREIWQVELEDDDGDDEERGKKGKVTICHIPPGNPDAAHTITISENALPAHMAHGDTMGECPDEEDESQDDEAPVDTTTTITLIKQVTNNNEGTAGPNDFDISVNGTLVQNGTTTTVAPYTLFAINETVAEGYEFVEITGDTECPQNLDEETISLEVGQDITCTIHNDDEGDATTITLIKEVTNDNEGTAGPNDFDISVNGTIVTSGSITTVASDTLFAINETVVGGYSFVKITGDTECPQNLDEETISLEPGQDITCTIHNDDVAPLESSQTTQTTEQSITQESDQMIIELQQKIEELEKRLQPLLAMLESGEYFGNTLDQTPPGETYSIVFEGDASSLEYESLIVEATGEIFMDTLVTTSEVVKFRMTGGEIAIGETNYDVLFGKARLTQSSTEADSMNLIAQVMDDDGNVNTLRLNIELESSISEIGILSINLEINEPSKIATLWSLSGTGNITLL